MKKINYILLVVTTLLCAGCATWGVLGGGQVKFKHVGFEASMPEGWMEYKPAHGFMATRDGYSLNNISVKKIKFLQRLANTKKRFQVGMLLDEILEVEIDSIKSNSGAYALDITKNEPITIDGIEAYRIEYEYSAVNGTNQGSKESELKVKAVQCGFIHNKFVYRIVFKAAKIHYYEDTVSDFESFLNSFKLLNS